MYAVNELKMPQKVWERTEIVHIVQQPSIEESEESQQEAQLGQNLKKSPG
jgi:hypothetical protein